LDSTLALRCVPRRLVHSRTTHTSSRAPSYAAGGVRHFTGKTRAGPNARSGGRSRRSALGMRAPHTTAREVCTRWDDPGGQASLREGRAAKGRCLAAMAQTRGSFVVKPGGLCHLRAPIVHGSRTHHLQTVFFRTFSFGKNVQNPVGLEDVIFLDATEIDWLSWSKGLARIPVPMRHHAHCARNGGRRSGVRATTQWGDI
jgi:hypothetical protein